MTTSATSLLHDYAANAVCILQPWTLEFDNISSLQIMALYVSGCIVMQLDCLKYCVAGCSDYVICATGSTDRLNPFGPFTVDYQVCLLPSHLASAFSSPVPSTLAFSAIIEAVLEQSECVSGHAAWDTHVAV